MMDLKKEDEEDILMFLYRIDDQQQVMEVWRKSSLLQVKSAIRESNGRQQGN